jgi:two-component system CheB/CheR fusion protein
MEAARKIISLLEEGIKKDLSCFDTKFLLESLNSRVNDYKNGELEKYLTDLQDDTAEQNSLYTGLFVPHSFFFRDRLSFAVLEELLLARIYSRKRGEKKLRIWSAGCAGGEEAYSLAIILAELAEKGEIGKDLSNLCD